jgi:DNA processing protein
LNQAHTEEEYWLALLRAPGVGPVNFVRLIKHFESVRAVFEAEPGQWRALNMKESLLKYLQHPDWAAIEKDMQWLTQPNHHLLTIDSPEYPPRLRQISNPPPILFVHGDIALLSSQQLAMVGTRHPSPEGTQTAREFAEYLAFQGFTITSGMAYGIDAVSHWGALAGSGKTIAVAGTGLDRVYPAKHRDLAHKIAQTGALISELPLGTPVHRSQFPIRSRIVSGLSLGTLVIEAPEKSGALYTARHATHQGREVFAIPGSIHNPLVKGCHQLIKEGAKLVETAADILEELLSKQTFLQSKNFCLEPVIHNKVSQTEIDTKFKISSIPTPSTKPTTIIEPNDSSNHTTTIDKIDSFVIPNETTASDESKTKDDLSDLDDDYVNLLDYLATGPTSIDNLVEQTGLTAGNISSMLLILELRGLVATQSGGLYTRTGGNR